MKKHGMKMLVALFALIAAQVIFAQDTMSNMGGANKQEVAAKLEKISAALQLTPAQKKQMLPILMQEAPKLQAVKSDTSLGPLQKAMKLKEIGSDTDSKVMPILTPQQQQKWQAMQAEERQQMMQNMDKR
jgi:hypothetical protein